ncbi:unnamed protein product [Leptosia nina]|uniref:Uncharacterized protein n=1 Tax=Leptosia nina TaxID=320188 RepID=A0AAV1JER8_9NEOP
MASLHTVVSDMTSTFNKQMEDFRKQLQGISTTTKDPSAKLATEFESFRLFVLDSLQALQSQVSALMNISDDQEMRSRHKMVLFHGIAEDDNNNPIGEVLQIVSKKLHLPNINEEAISRCQRLGKKLTGSKARPIIVKFRDMQVKENIWKAKTNLKASGVTVSEFLTKRRHSIFLQARKQFGLNNCWTKNGAIYILDSAGKRHRITCENDLHDVTPVDVSTGPEINKSNPGPSEDHDAGVTTRPKRINSKAKR